MTSLRVQRAHRLAKERKVNNLPGVATVGISQILQREANRPMQGGNCELPHKSLFGDSHLQREMFK